MSTMLQTTRTLDRITERAGLRPAGNGEWESDSARIRLAMTLRGWIEASAPASDVDSGSALTKHRDWAGPVKLTRVDGRWSRRFELCVAPELLLAREEIFFHDDEAEKSEALLARLIEVVPPALCCDLPLVNWQSPPSEFVAETIERAGCEPAADDAGGFRFSLKRPGGVTGQVRAECGAGKFRLAMPLGSWSRLQDPAKHAMLSLARQANDRCRMARIEWREAENGRAECEAVVDLRGIPYDASDDGESLALWRPALARGIDALALTLRRLGVELNVLADERNRALVDSLHAALGPRLWDR